MAGKSTTLVARPPAFLSTQDGACGAMIDASIVELSSESDPEDVVRAVCS